MPPTPDAARRAARAFAWAFWGSLAIKLALAATFPLTGDEALFIQWGRHPAAGYYDHPPMIGWWLAAMLPLGDALVWLRLPTVLVTPLIALGLVALARSVLPAARQPLAWWAGTAYLLLPWSWLFVLVTTDTPLVLLAGASMAAYLVADRHRQASAYALAGLLIGLAFLSKYFAALVGLAYAVHVLLWRRERWRVLPGMFLMALPAIAFNLAFNATHGWPNILFNLINRQSGNAWSAAHAAQFLGLLLYLFTPWLLFMAWRAMRTRRLAPAVEAATDAAAYANTGAAPVASIDAGPSDERARADRARAAAVLWIVPLAAFGLMALRREVGLHWLLAFLPPFVLWLCLACAAAASPVPARAAGAPPSPPERAWRRASLASLALSALHVVAVLGLLLSPLSWWRDSWRERVVFLRQADAVAAALTRELPPGRTLFALGYTPAAILAYHHGRYVPVFGEGSQYARQDDLWTDFRAFDGRDMRLFSRDPLDLAAYQPYFASLQTGHFELSGVTFHWLDGNGFRYAPYREQVLTAVQRRYHAIPPWLPLWGSPFCERYGFADCSPGSTAKGTRAATAHISS